VSRLVRIVAGLAALLLTLSVTVATAAASSAAPPSSASTSRNATAETLAQLRVATLGARAKKPVSFDLAGSRVAVGRRLRSAELRFGDGTHVAVRSLSHGLQHSYARPGAYVARFRVVDSAGHSSSVRRTVVVGGRNVKVYRSNVVRLPASSVTAIRPVDTTHESLTLAAGSPTPSKGQTLWVGRGSLDPFGIIGVVQSAASNPDGTSTATVANGTLRDLFKKLAVVSTSRLGSKANLAYVSHGRIRSHAVSSSVVPFTCKDSGTSASATVDVNVDLSKTRISTTINLAARIFSFGVIAKPTFAMSLGFQGKVTCQLQSDLGLIIPVPSVPGLVITASPYFDLSVSGAISATATFNPALFLYVARVPGDNSNFYQYNATTTASATGSASITLEGGIEIGVSEAEVAGLKVDVGPEITVSASDIGGGTKCVKVQSDIAISAQLYAHAFGFVDATLTFYNGHYLQTTLLNKCTTGPSAPSGSGSAPPSQGGGSGSPGGSSVPYTGPTVTETTGGVAQTWTDYVHAGGHQGPDIGSNQSVGIVCKTQGFKVANGNTWWYLIGSSPWNAQYYVSADPFYNNGQTSGPLRGTPFVDNAVPNCSSEVGGSPTPVTPPTIPTSGSGKTYPETTGGVTHTFTDYSEAGGTQGSSIPSNDTVQVTCKLQGFKVADGNTWWYEIATAPWSDTFYASADAFYNNGQTSGSLNGTPFVDNTVPDCSTPTQPPPPSNPVETTGGVTHTWTNYTNAGGTQGQSIGANQTVQITCRLTGFKVADGNTWWYQIASSPWNNAYYASADAFYNNGATSGSLQGTPFYDPAVPVCGSGSPTLSETTGGVTHTWTDYANAGGTQGQSIGGQATIQVTCRVQGFKVADGNTWWYRIASSPWNSGYYASADAFYNNGATSGSLQGTPFYDPAVPVC
jgi:hypothetical protein